MYSEQQTPILMPMATYSAAPCKDHRTPGVLTAPRPSVEAVPVSTLPFGATWTAAFSTYRNERRDCANPKPNEDRVRLDPATGVIVLADGITRTPNTNGHYPDPSPSAEAAELFCAKVVASRKEFSELSLAALRSIVARGNEAIGEFNAERFPRPDFALNDRAGVAMAIGIVEGNTLWLASIADCICVGIRNGSPLRIAWEKTSHSRAEYLRLGEASARETLRNKPGNPLSYGALTGEPEALLFVEYSKVPLHDISRLVFSSDGLLRLAQEEPSLLTSMSPGELVRYGRRLDVAHSETDDKTVVTLDRRST